MALAWQPVEILIVGTIEVEPTQRDDVLAAIRPLVQKTRQEEPGCLAYAFMADTVDDGVIRVIEHWQDEASLAAHFEHPNFFASKEVLGRRGSGASIIAKHRVDLSEPVRDGERRYRADFFTADG
jgi:quinol monooxygenase YgiN